jgi:hypothetical protein
MDTTVSDDMFTPDVIADPYSYYGRLRDEDPVHWNETYELWVVTAHHDLVWLTRFEEEDVRTRAHAILDRLGKKLPFAPVFDRRAAGALDDTALAQQIAEPHVVGRAVLVAEAARRHLAAARSSVIRAIDEIMERAPQGNHHLLDPDSNLLAAAVELLRSGRLDDATVAVFERMLRHSNPHVKWRLLEGTPADVRLIGAMFRVLAEGWGWQAGAARSWLAHFQTHESFEAARAAAGVSWTPILDDEEEDDDLDDDDENDDDEDDDGDEEDDEETN